MFRLLKTSTLLLSVFTVFPVKASINITESTPQRLVFTFEMKDFSSTIVNRGGEYYAEISFDGKNSELGMAGGPVVPAISVYAGVPAEGDIKISFISHSTNKIVLGRPMAVHGDDCTRRLEDEPAFVNPWISEAEYVRLGGYRAALLYIRPCLYDQKTGMLNLLQRATCIVEFPPSTSQLGKRKRVPSDYGTILNRMFLNFGVARNWRIPERTGLRKAAARSQIPSSSDMLKFTIGDGSNDINEGTNNENGIIKIMGSDLTAMFGQANINSVSLFASPKRELQSVTPQVSDIPTGVSEVPMLRVDLNSNGKIDESDYFLAFVTGTSDWYYDTSENIFKFALNRYDDYRHYWLLNTGHGLSMREFSQPSGAPDTVDVFRNHVFFKRSLRIQSKHEGGGDWAWVKLVTSSLATTSVFQYDLDLKNVVKDSVGYITLHKGMYMSDSLALNMNILPLYTNPSGKYLITDWISDTLTVNFFDRSSSQEGYCEIEAVEVDHCQYISMYGLQRLQVFSDNAPEVVCYRVSGLPEETCYLVRIPADESAAALIGIIPDTATSFVWSDSGGMGVQYFICSESALLTQNELSPHYRMIARGNRISDLRSSSNASDYLIIYHSDFASEAERLAEHKKSIGRFSNPRLVDIEDVFREFSGGNRDPSAIRNFLLYTYNEWTISPEYVVLFGNGHYDNKRYAATEVNYIPIYQDEDKCWEDFFTFLDPGEIPSEKVSTPDIFIGRVPCQTVAEAQIIVDKIIEFEGGESDFGAWRNRVLLVADDDMQRGSPDPISISSPHHISSDEIEKAVLAQDSAVDVRKVYLFEYAWNETYEKPEASRALFNEINNGVAFVNYFGHGSDHVWADEKVLRSEALGNMYNEKRYPVITSFSCSVGRFDKPGHECLSGSLVRLINAGAIASLSSTRLAYARYNETLGKSFYRHLFMRDSVWTIGQALLVAKVNNLDKNQKTYSILGDPSLKFGPATDSVDLKVFNEDGDVQIDTMKALQGIRVKGDVVRDGVKNTAFGSDDGTAWVEVGLYNPRQDSVKRKDNGYDSKVTYSLPGTPVFVGKTEVKNGSFEQFVFLPRKVSFNEPGVKLIAYAWCKDSGQSITNALSGKGYKGNLIFSGTADVEVSDTAGPRILVRCLYDNDRWNSGVGYTDEISAMLPVDVEISLFDEVGIDVAGTGPDEGLTFEVVDALSKRNINHNFQFDEGSYKQGRALLTFSEEDIEQGAYEMKITAQDLLGNISRVSVALEIVGQQEFKLGHVFNYPNPVRMNEGTRFFFTHTNTHAGSAEYGDFGDVDVTIKIYTLSGRLIRIIRNAANGYIWDCRDERGNQLSPNVYLYRVIAKTENMLGIDKTEKSPVKKLVICPPR